MAGKSKSDWLIYGATGYTGRLILAEAVKRGLNPTVAGRSSEAVQKLAAEYNLPWSVFSVDDGPAACAALQNKKLLLSVAGPFSATAQQMITACLDTGTHYLDVTGEIAAFEYAAKKDSLAKTAGITLLPGVGFDVVPSDCLAAHTAAHSKKPISLKIAIKGLGGPSKGTAKTMIEALGQGTALRRSGKIVYERPGSNLASFDFGNGSEEFLGVSWGDVSTAYYSTGIGDIEVFFPNEGTIKSMTKLSRLFGFIMGTKPVQAFLKRQIDAGPDGPNEEERAEAGAIIRAEVTDESGSVFISQLETPNGYTLTAKSAVLATERVLAGEVESGFKTPSMAFGSRFLDELSGCKLEDH